MKTDPGNITYTREKRVPHILNEMLLHLLKTKPEDPMLSLVVFLQSGEGKHRISRDPSWWPKEDRRPVAPAADKAGPSASPPAAAGAPAPPRADPPAPKERWPNTLSKRTWPRTEQHKQVTGPRRTVWPHTLSTRSWPRGVKWPYTLGERTWQRPLKGAPRAAKQDRLAWPYTLSTRAWPRVGGPAPAPAPAAAKAAVPPGAGLAALLESASPLLRNIRYLRPADRQPGESLAVLERSALPCHANVALLLDMARPVIKGVWPYNLSAAVWPRVRTIKISSQACRTRPASWPGTLSTVTRPATTVKRRWPYNLSYAVWPRAAGQFGPKPAARAGKWPETLSAMTYPRGAASPRKPRNYGIAALAAASPAKSGIGALLQAHTHTTGIVHAGHLPMQGEALSKLIQASMPGMTSLRKLTMMKAGDGVAALLRSSCKKHVHLRHLRKEPFSGLHGGMIGCGMWLNEGSLVPREPLRLHGGVLADGSVLCEGMP